MSRPSNDGYIRAVSKCLSWILRHHAVELGLKMRPDGYVTLDSVLAVPEVQRIKPPPTLAVVQQVVASNDKQRFGLMQEGETWYIRAHQGHSGAQTRIVDNEQLLKRVVDASAYEVCIHGTTLEAWELIQKTGLSRMARKHIHFAAHPKGSPNMKSGMRHSSEVLIHIDMARAMADGIAFYESENNVLLTEGQDGVLHPKYFSSVKVIGKHK